MIEHETRVKVTLSVYVNIGTDSHPEDIEEDTMKHIMTPIVADHLREIGEDYDSTHLAIDSWEYDDVKVLEDSV